MTDRADGDAETSTNLARPAAQLAGTVAYVADIVILLALIAQLFSGRISGGRAFIVGLLAIAAFLVAAGLSFYGGDHWSGLLVGFAAAYSLISAVVLLLASVRPEPGSGGGLQLAVVLLIAMSVAAMAMTTARIAGLPVRRLAIPFIVVAVILIVVATVIVVFDGSMSLADSRSFGLARLLLSLITTGVIISWFLVSGRLSNGPSPAETWRGRIIG